MRETNPLNCNLYNIKTTFEENKMFGIALLLGENGTSNQPGGMQVPCPASKTGSGM